MKFFENHKKDMTIFSISMIVFVFVLSHTAFSQTLPAITLTNVQVSQNSIVAGSSFRIIYSGSAVSPVDGVVLTARAMSGDIIIEDRKNAVEINSAGGPFKIDREFFVPPDTQSGWYDISASLMYNNISLSSKRLASAVYITGVPASPLPSVSANPDYHVGQIFPLSGTQGTLAITAVENLEYGFKKITFKENGPGYQPGGLSDVKVITPNGQFIDASGRVVGTDPVTAPWQSVSLSGYRQALDNLKDTNQPLLQQQYREQYGVNALQSPSPSPSVSSLNLGPLPPNGSDTASVPNASPSPIPSPIVVNPMPAPTPFFPLPKTERKIREDVMKAIWSGLVREGRPIDPITKALGSSDSGWINKLRGLFFKLEEDQIPMHEMQRYYSLAGQNYDQAIDSIKGAMDASQKKDYELAIKQYEFADFHIVRMRQNIEIGISFFPRIARGASILFIYQATTAPIGAVTNFIKPVFDGIVHYAANSDNTLSSELIAVLKAEAMEVISEWVSKKFKIEDIVNHQIGSSSLWNRLGANEKEEIKREIMRRIAKNTNIFVDTVRDAAVERMVNSLLDSVMPTSLPIVIPSPFPVLALINPSPIPSNVFTADLYHGIRNVRVVALQKFLQERGFFSAGILITGYFGNITKEAVQKFQAYYGITPSNGYVGPVTRAKLNALLLAH